MPGQVFSPGRVITFYSYKGGVGRSMALANVAALLAQAGKRVLAVDWDLEAPGLERYFASWLRGSRATSVGVVDLLTAFGAGKPLDWRSGLLEASPLGDTPVKILTAGKADARYVERLQGLRWEQLFGERNLGEYLEQLRSEWAEEYDFVLVDSRTGITDIGGICTILLPDWIVAFFTANEQSLEGVVRVAQMARQMHGNVPRERGRLVVIPVPSRDESRTERDKAERWHRVFAERLGAELDWLPRGVAPLEAIKQLKLPHVPFWNFGEELPVAHESLSERDTLSAAFAALARLLGSQLDWNEVVSGAATAGAAYARAEEAKKAAVVAQSASRRTLRWASVAVVVALLVVAGLVTAQRMQQRRSQEVAALVAEADQLAGTAPEAALPKYDAALALEPANTTARYRRGLALMRTNEPAKAEADFTAAIEGATSAGEGPDLRAELFAARAGARGRRNDLAAALADYTSAVELKPRDAGLWAALGGAHQALGEGGTDKEASFTKAIAAYSRAVELDPAATGALFNRAVVKERTGDRAGAAADFQLVVSSPASDRTLIEAANARLAQLFPGTDPRPPPPTQERPVVFLKYEAKEDTPAVRELFMALGRRGSRLDLRAEPELVMGNGRSEVRFFFAKDEEVAFQVRSLVETELAQQGTPVRLDLRFAPAPEQKDARPGTVEVWLPSLSLPNVQQRGSRGSTAK